LGNAGANTWRRAELRLRETRQTCRANGLVSTRDQNPAAQHDALAAAGCDRVFIDKASGTLASRPELDKALMSVNRSGDRLVVTKLPLI